MAKLCIEYVPTGSLKANPHNARTHNRHQRRKIAASMRQFGFLNPIIVDHEGCIVAGHGRWEVAKDEGMVTVPVIRIEHLTKDQIRAYIIADNKLAELAGWDKSILATELQHLINLDGDFDVTVTGFEVPEIDLILEDNAGSFDSDDKILPPATRAVTRLGETWSLGKNRIHCNDAMLSSSYTALMGGRKAGVVFTDPPYNVPIKGHVSGKGRVQHREFAMAVGEMTSPQFSDFLSQLLILIRQFSTAATVAFICMDWRHLTELLNALQGNGFELLNLCVWVKHNGGMGSLYRSQHELVLVMRAGSGRHRNNVQLGKFGRNRSNVWNYEGASNFGRPGEEGDLVSQHPTVKPVQLVADALVDCSVRGDIVLDSFLGSGSTLIAAERTGRICYGLELDPLYVDLAIRRWQRHTGGQAIHVESGRTFEEISAARSGSDQPHLEPQPKPPAGNLRPAGTKDRAKAAIGAKPAQGVRTSARREAGHG